MSDQIHYFAFSLKGWSAHKNLGDCIDRQLRANGGCHAVVEVQAPINALYSITGFLPMKFYDTSPFKPGEYVRITPVAASHNDVAEDLRAKCKDTTEWTTEKWREYANLCMLLDEAKQAYVHLNAELTDALITKFEHKYITSTAMNGRVAWSKELKQYVGLPGDPENEQNAATLNGWFSVWMAAHEAQQAKAQRPKCSVEAEIKAPFLTTMNGTPCAWEDILPHMPQGIVCYVANEEDWLHVNPDLAIIAQYRHNYSTDRYVGIDGSTYNFAEPALPNECTLNIAVDADVVDFGTVNEDRRVR